MKRKRILISGFASLVTVVVALGIFFTVDHFKVNRRLGEDEIGTLREQYPLANDCNPAPPHMSTRYVALDEYIDFYGGLTIILCEIAEYPSHEDKEIELAPGSAESTVYEKVTGNGQSIKVGYGGVWVNVLEVISAEDWVREKIEKKQILVTWSLLNPYPEYVPGNRMILALNTSPDRSDFGKVKAYYVTDDNFVIPDAKHSEESFHLEKYSYEGCTVEYFRRTAGKMNDEAIAKYEKELAAKELQAAN